MRTIRLMAFLALAAALVAAGCARKHTVVTPGGNVTVTENGGKSKTVKVDTGDGKATIEVEKKTITEKELGVAVYPGATAEMSGSYEGAPGQGEGMKQHMLTTPDDFDKVFEFYKSKLKNVQNTINQNTGDGKMGMFSAKAADGSDLSVNITTDKEAKVTRIQVISVQKGKE